MIIVTGGAGFIGSNFVRQWLANESDGVVNLDKLSYAGNLQSLADVAGNPRYRFVHGDIGDRKLVDALLVGGQRVLPAALEASGYTFAHRDLPAGLRAVLDA